MVKYRFIPIFSPWIYFLNSLIINEQFNLTAMAFVKNVYLQIQPS